MIFYWEISFDVCFTGLNIQIFSPALFCSSLSWNKCAGWYMQPVLIALFCTITMYQLRNVSLVIDLMHDLTLMVRSLLSQHWVKWHVMVFYLQSLQGKMAACLQVSDFWPNRDSVTCHTSQRGMWQCDTLVHSNEDLFFIPGSRISFGINIEWHSSNLPVKLKFLTVRVVSPCCDSNTVY